MLHIKQQTNDDCGVACVAMIAGISYGDAKRALFPESHDKLLDGPWDTNVRQIGRGLRMLGINAADRLRNMTVRNGIYGPPYSTVCQVGMDRVRWHWIAAEVVCWPNGVVRMIRWHDPLENHAVYDWHQLLHSPIRWLPLLDKESAV